MQPQTKFFSVASDSTECVIGLSLSSAAGVSWFDVRVSADPVWSSRTDHHSHSQSIVYKVTPFRYLSVWFVARFAQHEISI